jgi:hypothetical protein
MKKQKGDRQNKVQNSLQLQSFLTIRKEKLKSHPQIKRGGLDNRLEDLAMGQELLPNFNPVRKFSATVTSAT